jgi:hypothetical protein
MAKRIENPDVDDLGQGGVELSAVEFDSLLKYLDTCGVHQDTISLARDTGFIAPLVRSSGTQQIFEWLKMQSDVTVLSICRDGSLVGMKAYIQFLYDEGTWPTPD